MSNTLYRTETAYGSQERNIREVMAFEIQELGNTDIPEYLLTHYANCFSDAILECLRALANEQEIDELSESELYQIIDDVVNCLNRYFDVNLKYCLWLADKEVVKNLYGGTDETIDAYSTSLFILSDLGRDGKLFAYESLPQKLNSRIFFI